MPSGTLTSHYQARQSRRPFRFQEGGGEGSGGALVAAWQPDTEPATVPAVLMQTADLVRDTGFSPEVCHGIVHVYRALTRRR